MLMKRRYPLTGVRGSVRRVQNRARRSLCGSLWEEAMDLAHRTARESKRVLTCLLVRRQRFLEIAALYDGQLGQIQVTLERFLNLLRG